MYERRAVLFMDILGFKEMIAKNEEDKIFQALSRLGEWSKQLGIISLFSDCTVISAPIDDGRGVKIVSLLAGLLWLDLLRLGVLARGAVAVGDLHHSGNILFGKAMVEAYTLESSQAIYPRILLSTEARALALSAPPSPKFSEEIERLDYFDKFDQVIRQDFDGQFHLDVFHRLTIRPPHYNAPELSQTPPDFLKNRDHMHRIGAQSVEDLCRNGINGKAAPKYYWLLNYFNEGCGKTGRSPIVI